MKTLLVRRVLDPLLRRVGTAFAAFLLGALSVDPALVDQFVVAFIALVSVSVDLIASHLSRQDKN